MPRGAATATLFRELDGSPRSRDSVATEFKQFPSSTVHAAVAALAQTDSVTIDPHKLGYLPYGAGAFVCRDHRAMALLASEADYVFAHPPAEDHLTCYRQLGLYIPEGSKPGAMAAAVYVAHRVLPLDHAHFGRLPAQTIKAVEAFVARAERLTRECAPIANVCVPFAPDTNLVCLASNPRGNRSIAAMNEFVLRLDEEMRIDPGQPLQLREFFSSTTTIRLEILDSETARQLLDRLGLVTAEEPGGKRERLWVLRHTLMNPFLLDTENDISYIDRYFDFLQRRIAALCAASNAAMEAFVSG